MTKMVTTADWGADAHPMLTAFSPSSRGDTTVTCTITDADGKVVATDTTETAYASVTCFTRGS